MAEEASLSAETIHPDIVCDLRQLRCPNLLITVIKIIESAEPGQILLVRSCELNAPSSIGSWTRQSGHTLLGMVQEGDEFVFLIQCEAQLVTP